MSTGVIVRYLTVVQLSDLQQYLNSLNSSVALEPNVTIFEGLVYDLTGTYSSVFLTVGCTYVISCSLFVAIPLLQYRRNKAREIDLNGVQNTYTKFGTFDVSLLQAKPDIIPCHPQPKTKSIMQEADDGGCDHIDY